MATTINTQTQTKPVTGQPINRVDGRLKVMGEAHFSAEFPFDNIAHAVIIGSAIAKGRIQNIDVSAAENAPGVLSVITHRNAPKLNELGSESKVMALHRRCSRAPRQSSGLVLLRFISDNENFTVADIPEHTLLIAYLGNT